MFIAYHNDPVVHVPHVRLRNVGKMSDHVFRALGLPRPGLSADKNNLNEENTIATSTSAFSKSICSYIIFLETKTTITMAMGGNSRVFQRTDTYDI